MLNESGKRIAILVPNFLEYDGGARVADLQAEELIEKDNSVTIFALGADTKPIRAELFVLGMPRSLFWERVYRLLFPFDIVKAIRWLPKLKDYDLIIVHHPPMTWLGFLAKKFYHVPYIYWFHGLEEPYVFPHFHEKLYMRLSILFTKLTISNADRVIAVSKFAQKKLKEFTGKDSEVKYNPIDTRLFRPGLDGGEVRRRYNIGDAPVILSVGRLVPQKGYHLLVQAFRLIRKEIPEAKLFLVGEATFGYYLEDIKSMSDDSVILTGYISRKEMPYYYAACDIYTTCSLWENCNLPLLEALACNKPIVASDIPAFKEWEGPGITLVPAKNVEEFAQACIQKLREVQEQRLSS